jgi:hypothetical protein
VPSRFHSEFCFLKPCFLDFNLHAFPFFLKSFETTVWILNLTKKFPKHQRFVLAKRIEDAALSFQDHIVFATKTRRAQAALHQADFHLERLHQIHPRGPTRPPDQNLAPGLAVIPVILAPAWSAGDKGERRGGQN